MKYLKLFLILGLCGCSFPQGESRITIMSWNVQNLFDGIDQGSEYSEFDPGSGIWNSRLYLRRLERVGEILGQAWGAGPDLVVLQELENPGVLSDLCSGPLKKMGYGYSLAIPGFGIIRCGVISRYPITGVRVVDCGTWMGRSLRPALHFTVLLPGDEIDIIAVHWKSPRGGRRPTEEARRQEALIVREIILKEFRQAENPRIMVLGDLNTPGDAAVVPAALGPFDGSYSDAVLHRTDTPVFPRESKQLVLYDPEPSGGAPGTYFYDGRWERPDRVLLSPGFLTGDGWIFSDCRIGDFPVLLDSSGRPMRWRSDLEEGYSDHLPLLIEISR